MSHYHHLSIEERESIWEEKIKGSSLRKIAESIGRSPSTISREIRRNGGNKYRPSRAETNYRRHRAASVRKPLLNEKNLRQKVVALLVHQQWSPEQISERLAVEKCGKISYNTIYRAIKSGRLELPGTRKTRHGKYPLQRHLRRKGNKCSKEKPRPQGFVHQSIDARPVAANTRSQFGHWEGDLVYSSHHKRYIITIVDRRSRFLLTCSCANKKPREIADAITGLLKNLHPKFVRSLTLDRGREFASHALITTALPHLQIYFAHPMSPWERGLNENTNGLLRQYIPKRSYKRPFSDALLKEFTTKLNSRPRKCLAWKTPFEVFFHKSLHLT